MISFLFLTFLINFARSQPKSSCEPTNPCLNGASCFSIDSNTYKCMCSRAWTGANCETQIDFCQPNPCVNGAKCSNEGYFDYRCDCNPLNSHYTGKNCEIFNYCISQPCFNGGKCVNTDTSYACKCAQGFNGTNCENQIDYCSPNPCLNEGECVRWGFFSYKCQCPTHATGQNCETIDYCNSSAVGPCLKNGICRNDLHRSSYVCQCQDGYIGHNCEIEANACNLLPCKNGATCATCTENSTNKNCKHGALFSCNCASGFAGTTCEAFTLLKSCFKSCRRPNQCVERSSLFYCL